MTCFKGKIDLIKGWDQIKSDENLIFLLDIFKTVVDFDMSGTERSHLCPNLFRIETIMDINNKISGCRQR